MTIDQPTRRPARLVIGASLLAVVMTTAACGSSDDDAASAPPASTSASSSAAASSAGAGSSETGSSETDAETDAAACTKDSDYLSGTSTIVWTPDAKSKHQVAEAKPDKKFALTAAGKLDPATIEVAVDEVFTVTLAADSTGISVLTIGCDGGQTMSKGTPAGIYITAPGTYQVTSGLANDPAGTIVVS